VNVHGVFNLTKLALPHMLKRGAGSVINVASIGGVIGLPERLAYCTTKFAVVGMTKCLALDHARSGVRFNAICPARVETPFVQRRLQEYPDPAAAYRAMTESQPIGRMARPEEIAAAALYLASDESAFVTGSCLIIDGAYTAGK
jgi:NAD(P)-dependent dehydrogenase (short-subunit alcohol dehydrogenase family)